MLEVTVARAEANNDVVLEVRDDDEKVVFEKYCGHVFDDVFLVRDMTEICRGQEACFLCSLHVSCSCYVQSIRSNVLM
jgi:hypothetical protein